jgi:hypothetical protein
MDWPSTAVAQTLIGGMAHDARQALVEEGSMADGSTPDVAPERLAGRSSRRRGPRADSP